VASPEPVEPIPVPVVLAESGYTTFGGDSGDFATFGIILSNPNSGLRAHQMPLVIDFFDATDAFVGSQELLVTILPGQTTAVGGQVFGAGSARRMEVGLPDDTLAFVPAQGVGGTFELSGLSTRSADGLIVTTGRLTSRFSVTQRSVELIAIYRDASGRIMGAGSGGVESIDPERTADFDIVDGTPYAGLGSTDVFWRLSGIGQ
jgi:hypothetical protein